MEKKSKTHLHVLENILQLVEKHDLLLGRPKGPVAQQARDHLPREGVVLCNVQGHAVGELGVVRPDGFRLVQRDEGLDEHDLVLVLDGDGEAVDDGGKYLQHLRNAVVGLRLQDKLVEDVANHTADQGAPLGELAVDAVRNGLRGRWGRGEAQRK